jgi:2,5-furandicarboxylate decarboxylase 1
VNQSVYDLRAILDQVEKQGDLIRIVRPVDPKFEMPALMTKVEASGKAYLFEQVKGSPFQVVGGLFNRMDRFALALNGTKQPITHEDIAQRIEHATATGTESVRASLAPCKEVIHTGTDVDLLALPVPTFFELDSGPFITGGVGISRNPKTGAINVGCYRTLILDKDTMVVNASLLSDLQHFYQHTENNQQSFSINLAIGVDPALLLAAVSKPSAPLTEFDVAGDLHGTPIQLTRAETNDLPVPANAEFVIEGEVDFSVRLDNNLGEFAGQYGLENAPILRVKAITHRLGGLFYSILAGKNAEHGNVGMIAVYPARRALITSITAMSPNVRAVNVFADPRFGSMLHIVVAIDKDSDDQPHQLIRDAFALDANGFLVSQLVRRIVVVDSDVNVNDLDDVEWAIWARCMDSDSIAVFPNVTSWELDRASDSRKGSIRLAVDATRKAANDDPMIRPHTPGIEQIKLEDYVLNPTDPRR